MSKKKTLKNDKPSKDMNGSRRDDLHMKLNNHASFLADQKNRLDEHKNFVSSQMNHYMVIEERIDSLLDSRKSQLTDNYMYNHNIHSPHHLRKMQMEQRRRPDYNITNYIRKQHELQRHRKAFLGSYNPERHEKLKRKESLNQNWKNATKRKSKEGKTGSFMSQHMYYSPDKQNRKRFLREQNVKKKEDRKRIFKMNPMSREIVERRRYNQYYHQRNAENSKNNGNRNDTKRRNSISASSSLSSPSQYYQQKRPKFSEPNIYSTSLHPFQEKSTKKKKKQPEILYQQKMDEKNKKPIFFDIPTPFPRSSNKGHLSNYSVGNNDQNQGNNNGGHARDQIIEELTTPSYMKQKRKRVKSHYRSSKNKKEMNEKIFTFQPTINKNSEKIVKEKRKRREKQFFSLLQDQRYLLLMKNKEREREKNRKRRIRARRRSTMRRKKYLNHSDSFSNLHQLSKHNRSSPTTNENENRRGREENDDDYDESSTTSEEEEEEENDEQDQLKKQQTPEKNRKVRSNIEFYEKNRAWQNRLQNRIKNQRKRKEDGELSSCTFKPKINKFKREGMTTEIIDLNKKKKNENNNNNNTNIHVSNKNLSPKTPEIAAKGAFSRRIGYMKDIHNSRRKDQKRRRNYTPEIKMKYIF